MDSNGDTRFHREAGSVDIFRCQSSVNAGQETGPVSHGGQTRLILALKHTFFTPLFARKCELAHTGLFDDTKAGFG